MCGVCWRSWRGVEASGTGSERRSSGSMGTPPWSMRKRLASPAQEQSGQGALVLPRNMRDVAFSAVGEVARPATAVSGLQTSFGRLLFPRTAYQAAAPDRTTAAQQSA